MPTLQLRQPLLHGPEVVEVQELLRRHGHKVTVDGFFGRETHTAVRRFQRAAGLTVDGIVGERTLSALRARAPKEEAAAVEPAIGPDVSVHQGDIDWPAVKKAGATFAIAKATEGQDFRDKFFGPKRWQAMKAAGLVRGAYHFARPSGEPGDAVGEARDFHAAVQDAGGLQPGDLPYVLDLESTKLPAGATVEWARRFVGEIRRLTGHHPILYTFPSFWRDTLGNPQTTLGCPLWIAHYETDRPSVPGAWKNYAIWQHTQEGRCGGISGACDMNRLRGGAAGLARLTI